MMDSFTINVWLYTMQHFSRKFEIVTMGNGSLFKKGDTNTYNFLFGAASSVAGFLLDVNRSLQT